ncbi:transposase [Acidobacteria bacterium AH-259-L09]|nr:transposase [Acidobacteria bacterium AH-259-L09]
MAPRIPDIPEEERTPLTVALLEIIHLQEKQIQALKDEIARLKGQKPKPKIKPSMLEKSSGSKKENKAKEKRPGSAKRSKTSELKIHETVVVRPDNLPVGSKFKDYQDFTVQDIVFRPHNTVYRLERWQTSQGDYVVGKLPEGIAAGHFGQTLVSYILYQYYHAHVTQPLILEQLWELGVDISTGQVNRLITEGKERFHAEKDEILRVGLEISGYVNVDDTGARHEGNNGYCTHIGNELFAWFQSTGSKSRINFLRLLRAGNSDYVLNSDALDYMRAQKLPRAQLERLAANKKRSLASERSWKAVLRALNFTDERHIRIATEGALLGSVLEHGLNPELVIVSDDAGQFDVLRHALCWVHAERIVNKLVGFNEKQRQAVKEIRTWIWDLYADLKTYKQAPNDETKAELEARFDEIFGTKSCFVSLNLTLQRIRQNKSELLLVLERPDIPLHNNLSERDIREYVKKRKISGSTRSALGRRCRDSFTSLKKTCRKLGISFWEYLKDRVSGKNTIPPLTDLMRQRARNPPRPLVENVA